MDDPRLRLLLRHLDPPSGFRPWHGGASVLGSLRGVPAEVAAWKPAPERHTIWELALHIAFWKYIVLRKIVGGAPGGFPRSPADWPAVPDPPSDEAWTEDRRLLREVHRELADAMESFDPSRLGRTPEGGGSYTYEDLFTGIVLHDTYHAGQIQIMKRIHRSVTEG